MTRSWSSVLRRTVRKFVRDDGLDLAAGLTYYGVLAVFPALIALVSLLGLLGQGPQSAATILEVAHRLVPPEALGIVQPVLEHLAASTSAGLALVLGLLGALWFVSAYISAFGRAMNRVHAVPEGRPLHHLVATTAAVTLLLGSLAICAILLLLISGPVARALGEVLGLGSRVLLLWQLVKWPALALILALVIAVLYHTTPDVRQPRFRWLSPGALFAVVVWLGGSLLFGLYVSRVANYGATYGSLAGGIVFLVWLWVSNLALLLGAELDTELGRARQPQADAAAGIRSRPRGRTGLRPPRTSRPAGSGTSPRRPGGGSSGWG